MYTFTVRCCISNSSPFPHSVSSERKFPNNPWPFMSSTDQATLDETYNCTLLNIDEEKREFAQRIFRCPAVSIRPLLVHELAEILAIQFDEEDSPTFNAAWRPENAEEAVKSVCSSLIAIVDRGGHQIARFSHVFVKEYLTSDRLAAADDRLSTTTFSPNPQIPSLHTPASVSSSSSTTRSTGIP